MSANAMDTALEDVVSALPRKKMSGKRLVLFFLLPLLVAAGGGAALYVAGVFDELFDPAAAKIDPALPGFFYDLPQITVDLNTSGPRRVILQVVPTLELNRETDVAHVEKLIPRILDNFQLYLRELRLEDLEGSAGQYRLREELLRRVNAAVQPVQVREVLFTRFLLAN
ncbi:MAG TPA: flagellar basal body-associated FliL family protein [Alphaproteobacteria bacterium]|nr:flagellar basal body-associated FliL family protein [Alphaproteobacteria bacterium]